MHAHERQNVGPASLPAAQLDARLAERDGRWHCERFFTLTLAGGDVEIFFIDTSPGVASYQAAVWARNAGKSWLLTVPGPEVWKQDSGV